MTERLIWRQAWQRLAGMWRKALCALPAPHTSCRMSGETPVQKLRRVSRYGCRRACGKHIASDFGRMEAGLAGATHDWVVAMSRGVSEYFTQAFADSLWADEKGVVIDMLVLIRGLLPALAAVLVGACAVSPASELANNNLPAPTIAPQPAIQQSKGAAPQSSAAGDQEAVRRVALSLASMSDPASHTYKIGPQDVLEVTVFKAPELSKTIQVSETGTINFPLIGEFSAAGKTAREVEQEMSKKLGAKYLQNPQISVFVKDHFSQRVTFEGAVKKPGIYPIAGGLSLLQAVALSGGFEDTATKTVLIFRQDEGSGWPGSMILRAFARAASRTCNCRPATSSLPRAPISRKD